MISPHLTTLARGILLGTLACAAALSVHAQSSAPLTSQQIDRLAKAATVVILSGEGAGRLDRISTGVIVSKDGAVLTALHAVKGAAEVQVRLPDGDVFDHVELTGTDERRDIAALKIQAGGLPFLSVASTNALAEGDPVYSVTNANGLTWTATQGILSAIRPADEVPGAGLGFRLLQFTAPVAPGASGGALLDSKGRLIGIITSKMGSASAFAVPADSVVDLPGTSQPVAFGSGSELKMPVTPAAEVAASSAALRTADPKLILKNAKTIYLHSKTAFLTVDTLDRALALQKDWKALGLEIVQDPRVADVLIELDRPLFTYVHTFVMSDRRTSLVLGSGKATAFDGTIASGPLAKQIVAVFSGSRFQAGADKK